MPGIIDNIADILAPVIRFIHDTKVPEQINSIDYHGLFTNPWFMVPLVAVILYELFRRSIRSVISIVIFLGVWAFFGTPYMQEILTSDTVTLDKILPLLGGAVLLLAIIVYMYFLRSE
jgi:predicted RND superfamily exporter protein